MRRYQPIALSAFIVLGFFLATSPAQAAPRLQAGGSGSAQPLRPPAITENFLPVLPCNPNTTVGQEGCEERRVLADDKRLTADMKAIFRLLGTSSSRRDFLSAQATWLTYRDQDCASQSDAYQGGTEQPVLYASCLASDDVSRRADLSSFYDVLTQGLGSKVAFP